MAIDPDIAAQLGYAVEERNGVTLLDITPEVPGQVSPELYGILQGFPDDDTLAMGRNCHMVMTNAFIECAGLMEARHAGRSLSSEDRERILHNSVRMFLLEGKLAIDPENMVLALRLDRMLQRLVPVTSVTFIGRHRDFMQRGLLWRCAPEPHTDQEIMEFIHGCRVRLGTETEFFHNRNTGTRFLTLQDFRGIADALPRKPAFHERLEEIRVLLRSRNQRFSPELAFFKLEGTPPIAELDQLAALDGDTWGSGEREACAARFTELARQIAKRIPLCYRRNDTASEAWIDEMYAALSERPDSVSHDDEHELGMCPEFHHHIRWLPGATVTDRRLDVDENAEEIVRGLIESFAIFTGGLDYINVGRLIESRTRERMATGEERDVYVVVLKGVRTEEQIRIVRKEKWGVRHRIAKGESPAEAQRHTDEYSRYIADRLDALRALGYDIPAYVPFEVSFHTDESRPVHESFWQRPYVNGIASDKIPGESFSNPQFGRRLARLLGHAAGRNIVIGRRNAQGQVLFDDGDEVVAFDEAHLPTRIDLADMTGSFGDYAEPLVTQAPAYAAKLARFLGRCADHCAYWQRSHELADRFFDGMRGGFHEVRGRYLADPPHFDHMFDDHPYDIEGSFRRRWECVLRRLRETDIETVIETMKADDCLRPYLEQS